MIEEQYVSFETAKLTKEKGFDIPTRYGFSERRSLVRVDTSDNWNQDKGFYSRPTQSLLARWLREKHNFTVIIVPVIGYYRSVGITKYSFRLFKKWNLISNSSKSEDTYEKAMEAGLQEALKLIESEETND